MTLLALCFEQKLEKIKKKNLMKIFNFYNIRKTYITWACFRNGTVWLGNNRVF